MMMRMMAIAALGLLLLVPPAPASADNTATAASPARVSVPVPQAAKSANVAMLELSVRTRGSGNLGGVVRLGRSGGSMVEVGRFSAGGAGEQRYQFNVALALRHLDLAGGTATLEVAVIDRAGGPAPGGASLIIGEARIIAR